MIPLGLARRRRIANSLSLKLRRPPVSQDARWKLLAVCDGPASIPAMNARAVLRFVPLFALLVIAGCGCNCGVPPVADAKALPHADLPLRRAGADERDGAVAIRGRRVFPNKPAGDCSDRARIPLRGSGAGQHRRGGQRLRHRRDGTPYALRSSLTQKADPLRRARFFRTRRPVNGMAMSKRSGQRSRDRRTRSRSTGSLRTRRH